MADEIKAALTPDEWRARECYRGDGESLNLWLDAPDPDGSEDDDQAEYFVACDCGGDSVNATGNDRHAIAALALLGQPFGFTWADVDRLRDMHEEPIDASAARAFDALADRIAALLPPRV